MLAFGAEDDRILRIAEAGGARDDSLEDCVEVRRRGCDDPQDFARGGLTLQGLTEVVIALLKLLKQPRVLDGDDGLVRERLQQRDLLIREWPDLVSENRDAP